MVLLVQNADALTVISQTVSAIICALDSIQHRWPELRRVPWTYTNTIIECSDTETPSSSVITHKGHNLSIWLFIGCVTYRWPNILI